MRVTYYFQLIISVPAWDVSPLLRGSMSPSSNYPSQTSSSAASQPTSPENPVELTPEAAVDSNLPEANASLEQTEATVEPSEKTISESIESTESTSAAEAETQTQNPPDEPDARLLQHPIPPPSEPRQYRAIGLVRGRYQASEEQFTQGTLYTPDGVEIDAVLLGRVMSLVKKHLDLNEEHLWVFILGLDRKRKICMSRLSGCGNPKP